MPRKTKEVKQDTEKIEEIVDKKVAKTTTKKAIAVASKTKKESTKATKKSSSTTKKATSSTKKASDKNKALDKATKTSSKSVLTAKAKKSSTPKATSTTKKATKAKSTTKTATKRTSTRSTSSKKSKEPKKEVIVNEYYDLPYRYNQTIVKILAQTPNNLFVYWDISDKDRDILKKQYGDDFFEKTRPVLIVHNDTLNYSFEVEINDFANSWYLHVNDSKSDYRIELGRRPINYYKFNEDVKNYNNDVTYNIDYIKISTSNEIESPNDRILFNPNEKTIYYRNVKTNETIAKPITSLSFMQNIGKIYNIYELYKQIYKEENIEDIYDLKNPSSGNPSSGSLSSSNFRS